MLTTMLWLFFSQLCLAVYTPLSTNDMQMELWDNGGNNPTWHLTLDPKYAGNPGHEYVSKVANECWNWASKQTNAKGASGQNTVVVAALYNAGTGLIDVSTVPRGTRAAQMAMLREKTPVWNGAASAYVTRTGLYCAEDGVLFNVESTENAGIDAGKYVDGSFMIAWGPSNDGPNGQAWNPCSYKRKTPTAGCRSVLTSLDIAWEKNSLPFSWPATPEPIEGDEGTGVDENPQADAAEIQDIQMGDFPHKKRNDLAMNPETSETESKSFALRGRAQALARRSDTAVASDAAPSWPAYTGNVAFPTKKTDITTIASTWFGSSTGTSTGTSTKSSPAVTPPPASTLPCTFQEADPDQGRDQGGCVCTVSGKTSTWQMASMGTKTVWGISDYCSYTAPPSHPSSITTDVTSWTSNCQACTLTGGIADSPSCTTVAKCTPTQPVPTFAAWVANRKLDIGDAQGTDNGTSLAKDMFKQLSSFCSGTSCDTGKYAQMKDVETALGGDEEPLKPQMYWENAVFSDMNTLQDMLSAGLSTWIAASGKMCQEVEYEAEEDLTGSGCGKGPLPMKRSDNTTIMITPHFAERREKRCDEDCVHPLPECHYKAYICSAPDLITVVKSDGKGNPYANEINIGINYGKQDAFDEFLCDLIVDGLTTIAMALFPELLPVEGAEEVEFQALCGEIGNLANGGS